MARPSITLPAGGDPVEFITIGSGQISPIGLTVDEITRPGINGHAFRENAQRAPVVELTAKVDCTTAAAAKALHVQILAAQGALVTIKDDYGTTYANLMLLAAEKISLQPLAKAVGGVATNATALLTLRLRVQPTTA